MNRVSTLLFILFFISSCCPSKEYFQEKFSSSSEILDKLNDNTLSISGKLSDNNDKLEALHSNCCKQNIVCDSSTAYGQVVNMALDRNTNQLGLIEFDESDGELVLFRQSETDSVYLKDWVNFEVCKENDIYFARNIRLAKEKVNMVHNKYSLDSHNDFWHSKFPRHFRGHILNRKDIDNYSFRNKIYTPAVFERISGSERDTINVYVEKEVETFESVEYFVAFFSSDISQPYYTHMERRFIVEILTEHENH